MSEPMNLLEDERVQGAMRGCLLLSLLGCLAGWRVSPGPPLPDAPQAEPPRIVTLDDGRVVFDPSGAPEILDATGTAWTQLVPTGAHALGTTVAIPGGVLVAQAVIAPGPQHRRGALVWDRVTGAWRPSGGLAIERIQGQHMAAALADGSVLVVGGVVASNSVSAEAERWTRAADQFVAAGQLRAARYDATLTPLPDGRALVAAGSTRYGRGGATLQADVYNPKTNAWTTTGDLHVKRRGHTATLLSDGSVLVAGGQDDNDAAVAELEVWSPKTGTWTIAGKLREPRAYHGAVALSKSRVMFVGGVTNDGPYVRLENGNTVLSAETWDQATKTWEPMFYPPHGYVAPAVARLPDGRIVVASGFDFVTGHKRVEIWSPGAAPPQPWELAIPVPDPLAGTVAFAHSRARRFSNGSWTNIPQPSYLGEGTTATMLADGRALVVGGYARGKLGGEVLDPTKLAWSGVSLARPRSHHAVATLADGRVLYAGGVGLAPKETRPTMRGPIAPPLRTVELFDPKSDQFTATGSLSIERVDAAAATLADGRVLITGGRQKIGGSSTVEVWSAKTNTFAPAAMMNAARERHTATTLSDGRVVVIGGDDAGTFEIYDPKQDRWSPRQPLPERWHGHEARLLPDGRVLVTLRFRSVILRF